jgi:hypothetical protein
VLIDWSNGRNDWDGSGKENIKTTTIGSLDENPKQVAVMCLNLQQGLMVVVVVASRK